MMRKSLCIAWMVSLFGLSAALFAQSPTSGDPAELRNWLDAGADRPEYSDVLLRLLRTAPDLETFTNDLERYQGGLTRDAGQRNIFMEAGYLHETANRYFEAGRWYARAMEIDPSDWEAVLRRAAMSIETGENAEAIVLLTRVVQGAPDRLVQRRAAILRARAFLLDEQYERAYRHARSLVGDDEHESVETSAAFLLFEVSDALDRPDGVDLAREILDSTSQDNPERALVEGRVAYLPLPSRMIPSRIPRITEAPTVEAETEPESVRPPDPPQRSVRGVQVGSFRDPENALYMQRDMESLGFDAIVEEYRIGDDRYHRVLIPVPEGANDAAVQSRILQLKERGIEGMLLFR